MGAAKLSLVFGETLPALDLGGMYAKVVIGELKLRAAACKSQLTPKTLPGVVRLSMLQKYSSGSMKLQPVAILGADGATVVW